MPRRPKRAPVEGAAPDRWTSWLERNEKLVVVAIAILAATLRLAHLVQIEHSDPFFDLPAVDPKVYHDWAVEIAEGDVLGDDVFFLSPLYPYFLAAIYALAGPSFFAAKLVQMVLGVLCCVMVYFLAKRVFDIRVGAVAGAIAAVYVMSIFYEGVLLVTGIQTPLNLAFALLLLSADRKPAAWRWLAAGAALGLSAIARPNVLMLGGFVLPWMYLSLRGRLPTARIGIAAALFCAGIGAMVFPVTIRNWVVGDDFVLVSSQGGVNLYIGNGPDACGRFVVPRIFPPTRADDPLQQREEYHRYAEEQSGRDLEPSEVSAFWTDRTLEHIAAHPGKWLGNLGLKLALFVNHIELGNSRDFYSSRQFSAVTRMPLPGFGVVGPLALLGMALAIRRLRRAYLLYAMVATYAVSLVAFFVLAHYRMPAIPFFIVFAAFAVVWLVDALRARRALAALVAAIALVPAGAAVNADVVDLSGDQFMVHYNLANKYRLKGETDLAIAAYERSIELNPHYISSHNNLALLCEKDRANHGKAKREWRVVLRMARRRGDGMYVERAEKHLYWLEHRPEALLGDPSAGGEGAARDGR